VVSIILTFALPALTTLYAQFKADLPLATRILIAITSFTRNTVSFCCWRWLYFVLLAILFAQSDRGQLALDGALLRLPLAGAINVRSILARYTRTLSLLCAPYSARGYHGPG